MRLWTRPKGRGEVESMTEFSGEKKEEDMISSDMSIHQPIYRYHRRYPHFYKIRTEMGLAQWLTRCKITMMSGTDEHPSLSRQAVIPLFAETPVETRVSLSFFVRRVLVCHFSRHMRDPQFVALNGSCFCVNKFAVTSCVESMEFDCRAVGPGGCREGAER